MGTVFINGQMAPTMKVISKMTESMVSAKLYMRMAKKPIYSGSKGKPSPNYQNSNG